MTATGWEWGPCAGWTAEISGPDYWSTIAARTPAKLDDKWDEAEGFDQPWPEIGNAK